MSVLSVIRGYVRTEKSAGLKTTQNTYEFEVDLSANKVSVKQAVESKFGVKVETVRTMIVSGKTKQLGRYRGRTPDWKKAIVRLKKGSVIKELEG